MNTASRLAEPIPPSVNGAAAPRTEPVALEPRIPVEHNIPLRAVAFTPGESIAALTAIGLLIYTAVRVF